MKKSLFGIVAMAGMLFATSCSQEDLAFKTGETQVTFEVGVNNPMLTRAISDGSGANTLIYQVYQNGNTVGEQVSQDITSWPTTVSLTLKAGETYSVVFWAQNNACTAYNTADLTAVTVNYTGALNNDETRDAFYAMQPVTITGGETQSLSVSLKRPFAQLNVGMTEDQLNGATINNSSLTVSGGVNNQINLLTGAVSGADTNSEVSFGLNAVPAEDLTVGENTYTWLSMTYILPGDNVSVAYVFEGSQNSSLDMSNVPLQKNMRTNILGNVFTGDVDIEVSKDPSFEGDNDLEGELSNGGIVVSGLSYSLEEGTLTLNANYSGMDQNDIQSASFILTPTTDPKALRTRAADAITLPATVGDGTLSYTGTPELAAGQYYAITVSIVPKEGQEITLTPSSTTQTPGFTTPETEQPGDDSVIKVTAAEFNALQLTSDDSVEEYQLTGVVTGITNTQYGNFNLKDDTGEAMIYGLYTSEGGGFAETGVSEGDKITLKGHAKDYKGQNEIVNGTLVAIVEYAPQFSNLTATVNGTDVTFSVDFTNKSNIAIAKSGFTYSFNSAETTVNATPNGGTMTATVSGLASGSYTVKAFINDIQSTVASFRIADPSGGQEVTYTASWDAYGQNGSNNSYAGQCTMNIDGIDWVLEGNSTMNPWRLGGKDLTGVDRALYTATPIPENISSIVLENGTATATVNSFKIIVASDAEFNNVVDTFDYPSFTASTSTTVNRPSSSNWSNCYYKVVYNVTCGGSNQYVQMKQITLTGN